MCCIRVSCIGQCDCHQLINWFGLAHCLSYRECSTIVLLKVSSFVVVSVGKRKQSSLLYHNWSMFCVVHDIVLDLCHVDVHNTDMSVYPRGYHGLSPPVACAVCGQCMHVITEANGFGLCRCGLCGHGVWISQSPMLI